MMEDVILMGNVGWTWTGLMNWRQMLIDSHARARAFRRLVMTDKQGHTHTHTHTYTWRQADCQNVIHVRVRP